MRAEVDARVAAHFLFFGAGQAIEYYGDPTTAGATVARAASGPRAARAAHDARASTESSNEPPPRLRGPPDGLASCTPAAAGELAATAARPRLRRSRARRDSPSGAARQRRRRGAGSGSASSSRESSPRCSCRRATPSARASSSRARRRSTRARTCAMAQAQRDKARRDAERAGRLAREGAIAQQRARRRAEPARGGRGAGRLRPQDALERTQARRTGGRDGLRARWPSPARRWARASPILLLDTTGDLLVRAGATERELAPLRIGQAAHARDRGRRRAARGPADEHRHDARTRRRPLRGRGHARTRSPRLRPGRWCGCASTAGARSSAAAHPARGPRPPPGPRLRLRSTSGRDVHQRPIVVDQAEGREIVGALGLAAASGSSPRAPTSCRTARRCGSWRRRDERPRSTLPHDALTSATSRSGRSVAGGWCSSARSAWSSRRRSPGLLIPRLEEPRIDVPGMTVSIVYPGASPEDVEIQVVKPVEEVLYELPDVEWVEAVACPSVALFVVRFEDERRHGRHGREGARQGRWARSATCRRR